MVLLLFLDCPFSCNIEIENDGKNPTSSLRAAPKSFVLHAQTRKKS